MADTKLSLKKKSRLAANLKALRGSRELSAEEVAARLHKSRGYVYQMERGVFTPPIAIIVQLRTIYRQKTLKPFFDGI